MMFNNISMELDSIKESLVDEISVRLFNARLMYSICRDDVSFSREVSNFCKYKISNIPFLENKVRDLNSKCIVIYGAGHNGRCAYELLRNVTDWGGEIRFYDADADKHNAFTDISFIEYNEIIERHNDICVVITPTLGCLEIYKQLLSNGFPHNNIFIPLEEVLTAYVEGQYFDFFTPRDDEVFIDGGAYDGNTARAFFYWSGGKYDRIISFEGNPKQYTIINNTTSGLHDYDLVKKGMWSGKDHLRFYSKIAAGSFIGSVGDMEIDVDSIDNILSGKRASFIKMDIEGSEYESLLGAEKTIKKWTPRMAISVYHKPEDIFRIPVLIKKINTNYRFALRHYSSWINETVLYAWVE